MASVPNEEFRSNRKNQCRFSFQSYANEPIAPARVLTPRAIFSCDCTPKLSRIMLFLGSFAFIGIAVSPRNIEDSGFHRTAKQFPISAGIDVLRQLKPYIQATLRTLVQLRGFQRNARRPP